MMTQQLEVSILAAPLAAIDRRALSQAWYAALRLGRRGSQPPAAGVREAGGFSHAALRAAHPGAQPVAPSSFREAAAPRANAAKELRSGAAVERARSRFARAVRPQLAGAIEKAFADAALRRATFSVGRGSARIHVVLQTKGNRTTLIALCSPQLSASVARALAQARVALSARGIGVEVRAQGGNACS
jgi:hypothetical protein